MATIKAIIFDVGGVLKTDTYAPNKEMHALAERIQATGYKTAILSNTIAPHADFNRTHGVYTGFDLLVLSYEVGMRKPAQQIYEYTIRQLGVAPEEALMIDDMEENVEGARAAGLQALLFIDIHQLKKDIAALGISV